MDIVVLSQHVLQLLQLLTFKYFSAWYFLKDATTATRLSPLNLWSPAESATSDCLWHLTQMALVSRHLGRLCTRLTSSASSSVQSRRSLCDNTIIDPSIGLNSSEKQIQTTAYQFALKEFRPYMKEWDENEHCPRDQLCKAAQLGFGALTASSDFGGSDLSRLETSLIIEALSQGCVSTTALLSIHNMAVTMLDKFGGEELKSRFLPSLASFEKMASYCLTEPSAGKCLVGDWSTKKMYSNLTYVFRFWCCQSSHICHQERWILCL